MHTQGAQLGRSKIRSSQSIGLIVHAGYFTFLVLLALACSWQTGQFHWTNSITEVARSTGLSDPFYFSTGALDVARHGWFTPANEWLINLWPPGFMWLLGQILRAFGEEVPVLMPLLALSALCCVTWMGLLRKYLLLSGSNPVLATAAPLAPFLFPLSSFFLLSPIGLALGETFSISLFLIGFLLVLVAQRKESWLEAVLAGLAFAAAAYARSQFELVVQFLTLGGMFLFGVAAVAFVVTRKTLVHRSVLTTVALALLSAHAAMAPWRYHNFTKVQRPVWVTTSSLVFENSLRRESELRSAGAAFVVEGGGHLACKLEPSYCGRKEPTYFYGAFARNMGAWIMEKVQRLPSYWMAPPRVTEVVRVTASASVFEKLANLAFLACMVLALQRLWSIRRHPAFPVHAWMQLSLYACLAGVYTLVHFEARYLYLPKIFGVVALVAVMACGRTSTVRPARGGTG